MQAEWHRFQRLGLKLLLDANSGSLHLLDDVSWDVMPLFPGTGPAAAVFALADVHPEEEVRRAWGELESLVQEGMLFSPPPPAPGDSPPGPLQGLCLHVSHDCDLACRYCFGGGGSFGGERGLMSPAVGCRAVDFLLESSSPGSPLEVDFFGGEPLLNLETVRQVVAHARQRGMRRGQDFSFTLTTNALKLDRSARLWLQEEGINLVLSLDGRPRVHDHHRPLPRGGGSFAPVFEHIQAAVAERPGPDCVVRGTFSAGNLDFSRDVLYLADLGLKNLSLEPVVLDSGSLALRPEHLPRIEAEYRRLARAFLRRRRQGDPFDFFHFRVYLQQGPCLSRRLSGCGAGHRYLAVDPSGRIYPCHQFVGRDEFCLGDLERGLERTGLQRDFQRAHVYSKEWCRSCWARFFCSGGCHANNCALGGGLLHPYPLGCELSRLRLEFALAVQARQALEDGVEGSGGPQGRAGHRAGISATGRE